tara:strand:+ start:81 stop:371 length:291 start_codon:yes stop_codon:yes gene_type:complete
MTLQDYNAIKELIDGIVGIETKQGENLKIAIKNYFEDSALKVKLVNKISNDNHFYQPYSTHMDSNDADRAMKRYTKKLKEKTKKLKEKGQFCGISS